MFKNFSAGNMTQRGLTGMEIYIDSQTLNTLSIKFSSVVFEWQLL